MLIGRVFDIKRYAVHDGPGIRTTVFLKGCPLRCAWCHNPESQSRELEFQWRQDACIACDYCVDACESGALARDDVEGQRRDMDRCGRCMRCAGACPSEATEAIGRDVSVAELLAEIERDAPFYAESGGGVTLSGGEPLMQGAFAVELLRACGEHDLHRAVDTCGSVPRGALMAAAEHAELFLYDLKHMDDPTHRCVTGASNRLILENLTALAETDVGIEVRVPVIPGVNDEAENARATAAFVAGLRRPMRVRLLAYHPMAASKYRRLDMPNGMSSETRPPSVEAMAAFAEPFVERGLSVTHDGDRSDESVRAER